MSDLLLALLRAALPAGTLLTERADRHVYGFDNSRRHALPVAVVLACQVAEVQATVRACAQTGTPLTARGRGTATTGAAVPSEGGVVLSLERMDQILEISAADRIARVQPGVLNGSLQEALAAYGLFWPPDPTSAPYASIGGNLACNAGGPRTVKYGASRDNVLALEVVDGSGELLRCGQRTSKGSVGYDLARLLVGSEGTLGIITAATLRLLPRPAARQALRAVYATVEAAAAGVAAIMAQPAIPSAVEFMDARALDLLRRHAGLALPPGEALLLLEVDGAANTLAEQADAVQAAATVAGLTAFDSAGTPTEAEALWAARKALSPLLRQLKPRKINEDVVVPVSRLPALVRGVQEIATREALLILCFGHAGNGNLHVNLLFDPAEPGQSEAAERALSALFALVLSLDGTLSGEHGIGLDKRAFVPAALDAHALSLMRGVKALFDPHGILNPGKIWLPA